MSPQRLIVLKFGGSVLRNEESLRRSVHEIQRWRRDDYRVVAVVSALGGVTDELLQSCRAVAANSSGHAVAAVAAGGEQHCASILGLLLDRAGIPSRVLSPVAIGLIAEGPALEAEPRHLDSGPIQAALDQDEVVVVPGFVARDNQHRTVVLGRGGSDLTALFLAHKLGAWRCRLVKDVDGLYERDPAIPGPTPKRYASVSWDDALKTDGAIVQHKATLFARAHNVTFELGSVNGVQPTVIGAGPTVLDSERESFRPLRVALLGLGTVGTGIFELLDAMPETFVVTNVLVRDRDRPRDVKVDPDVLTTDASVSFDHVDLVVEAIGGTTQAHELIERALESGAHVVTANKAVVADAADRLHRLARRQGCRFFYSAAVGGSTPVLERLTRNSKDLACVRGVLNGTVNFVLDGLAGGSAGTELLEEARRRGFTEGDATRDFSGQDAADKLSVLAVVLGRSLDPDSVERDAVDETTAARALAALYASRVLRQVSTISFNEEHIRARVALEELELEDPLAACDGEHNVVVFERSEGPREVARGKGAGRWPTAESLMGDVLQIDRDRRAQPGSRSVSAIRSRRSVIRGL